MGKGKYMGLDFGDKRVGVAISDENKEISFPRDFLEYGSDRDLLSQLKTICEQDEVIKIILGMPINMDGKLGQRAQKTRLFYDKLKKILPEISIELFDERLSTQFAVQSLRGQGIRDKDQKGKRDALSAQIILQNYLSSLK
jgi:putative Holliday junction resolvase